MPELAEVEITRRKLLPLIKNKTFADFWTDWPRGLKLARPDFVRRDIKGRKILDGHRVGKVIFLHLSGRPRTRATAPEHPSTSSGYKSTVLDTASPDCKAIEDPRQSRDTVQGGPERMLAFHQRMSGRLEYSPRSYSNVLKNIGINKRTAAGGRRRTHFILKFSDGSELRFVDPRKFGLVWYGSPQDFQKDKYLKNLGVDLKKLTFEEFREKLRSRNQIIKAFLLRQDIISGIGNIIANESLWAARIHPQRKTSALSEKEIKTLFDSLQKTVDEILKAGGTSMRNWQAPGGKKGGYQELYKVYNRAGEKCIRCGHKIRRIITAGRGTSFCPKCQKTH